jgi:hypothetical protein
MLDCKTNPANQTHNPPTKPSLPKPDPTMMTDCITNHQTEPRPNNLTMLTID